MANRALTPLLLTFLLTATAFAGDTPFIGRWKLNGSKTSFSDRMKVESAGGNQYTFDFSAGGSETIAIDGMDHPGIFGTTLSVTEEGPRAWKVVRKAHGRTMITASWTLSDDGKTLTDDFTQFGADGSPFNVKYVYANKAAANGFAGKWESISATLNSVYMIEVRPWQGDGLSFIDALVGQTRNVKFDGKDYPEAGTNANAHATTSIRRVNEHTVEMTRMVDGKIVERRQVALSADLNTLTMTTRATSGGEPVTFVFDRQ